MNKEIWKLIPEYPNYEVSNFGNVRNKEGKILYKEPNKKGYLRVKLSKEGKQKKIRIHRLVGQAFIPNPDNLPQINHKDFNKQNNRADNLEWCDNWYNSHYKGVVNE